MFIWHGSFPQFSRASVRRAIDAGGVTVQGKSAKSRPAFERGRATFDRRCPSRRPGRCRKIFRWRFCSKTSIWRRSTSRRAWSCIRRRGIGRARSPRHWRFIFNSSAAPAGRRGRESCIGLDRDTSGVLVVAKTDAAHYALAEQFGGRTVEKEYFAIVVGLPDSDRDVIDMPIGASSVSARKNGDPPRSRHQPAGANEVRSGRTLRRFRRAASDAENGADASDSRASGGDRLPGAVRQAIRRPRGDHARRNSARFVRSIRFAERGRLCMRGG